MLANQWDLVNLYVTLHPARVGCILLKAHGTNFKIDHMLRHKADPNNFKGTEITQNVFFNGNEIKLEIRNIKTIGKSPKTPTCF